MVNPEHIKEAQDRIMGRQIGRHAVESSQNSKEKNTLVVRQGVFVEVEFDGMSKRFYVVSTDPDLNRVEQVSQLGLPQGVMALWLDHELGVEFAGKSIGESITARNGKTMTIKQIAETLEDLELDQS